MLEDFNYYKSKLIRFIHWDKLFGLLDMFLDFIFLRIGYCKAKIKDILDLVAILIFIIISSHNLACCWMYLGRLDEHKLAEIADPQDYPQLSWIYNSKNHINPTDIKSIYIYSIYWVMMTITTVGYGDLTGSNKYEYIFSMVLEVYFL